jgi:hypothetical protein
VTGAEYLCVCICQGPLAFLGLSVADFQRVQDAREPWLFELMLNKRGRS